MRLPQHSRLHQKTIFFENENSKRLTWGSPPLSRLGSQRRRLIPALSLDTPSPARKPANSAGARWVDGPLRSTQRGLGEPFEIKVYEIDDVERLQRRRGGSGKVSHLLAQGGHPWQVPGPPPPAGPQGGSSDPGRLRSRLPVRVGAVAVSQGRTFARTLESSTFPHLNRLRGSEAGEPVLWGLFRLRPGTPAAFPFEGPL